jgi:hypothetical protein
MRDGQAPRGFAAASIKTPGLPGGTEERFAGHGVTGLPFRSGHYLAHGDTLVLRMDYLEAVIHKPAP